MTKVKRRGAVPRSQTQADRRASTRQALVAAAARLFQRNGIAETTVSQVAAEAGVAHGSVYYHFSGIEELVEVLAVESIQGILARTADIMATVSDPRLLPCVAARVILRVFLGDPVIHWLVERPYVFTRTFEEVAGPFMRRYEGPAIEKGLLAPAGGHETWIATLPWILLHELRSAADDRRGDPRKHEETFARVCMRLMGIPDADAPKLLARSLELVARRKI